MKAIDLLQAIVNAGSTEGIGMAKRYDDDSMTRNEWLNTWFGTAAFESGSEAEIEPGLWLYVYVNVNDRTDPLEGCAPAAVLAHPDVKEERIFLYRIDE